MPNRVQYLVGNQWQMLGDYESPERAIEVAKNFERQNKGTRTRVIGKYKTNPIPIPQPSNNDPRGPERTIISIDNSTFGKKFITLSCGHILQLNPSSSYKIGENCHCLKCATPHTGRY